MSDSFKKNAGKASVPEPVHDEEISGFSQEYVHAVAASPERLKLPDFAQGSVLRVILRMGLPSVIGFVAMTIYDLADMFWVAKLGAQHVAAIAIFESFYMVLVFTNEIAGLGSVAVISRRWGEGDAMRAAAAIKETFILKIICAVISGTLGLALLRPLMELMGARGEVIELGVQYGRIHMFGMVIYFLSYTVFTSLRCIEAPRLAMVVMLLGSLLNMALDPFLIFGIGPFPAMGLTGAAVASVISYALTILFGAYILYSGKAPLKFRLRTGLPVQARSMLEMMRIGAPGGVNQFSFTLSRAIILPFIAQFGTIVVAAYGMTLRVTQLAILVIWGLGMGVSPLIGNLLGAGLKDRVRETARHSMILSVVLMTAMGILIFAFAPQIVIAFFQDVESLSVSVELLRIYALALPFIGVWIIAESLFHGAGDNIPPMLISIITSWAIEIPMILFFTKFLHFDQSAIWWSRVFYAFSGAVICALLIKQGKWMQKNV